MGVFNFVDQAFIVMEDLGTLLDAWGFCVDSINQFVCRPNTSSDHGKVLFSGDNHYYV